MHIIEFQVHLMAMCCAQACAVLDSSCILRAQFAAQLRNSVHA